MDKWTEYRGESELPLNPGDDVFVTVFFQKTNRREVIRTFWNGSEFTRYWDDGEDEGDPGYVTAWMKDPKPEPFFL